jgi:hypothetical protein
MQPVYSPYAPYQPPVAYGAAPGAGLYDRVRAAAAPAVVLLAICAALPLLNWLFWTVAGGAVPPDARETAATIYLGLKSLLQLVAAIVFFVWLHRIHVAVRQEQGATQFTPGMAVGGWFIPFANFVLPMLSMRDVWQRKMGGDRSFIVPVWWITYLVSTIYTVAYQMLLSTQSFEGLKTLMTLFPFPLPLALHLGAFVSWLLMVRWLTDRAVQSTARPVAFG